MRCNYCGEIRGSCLTHVCDGVLVPESKPGDTVKFPRFPEYLDPLAAAREDVCSNCGHCVVCDAVNADKWKWQPIETAPIGETKLLVWDPTTFEPAVAYFDNEDGHWWDLSSAVVIEPSHWLMVVPDGPK